MNYITIDTIGKEIVAHCTWRPEERVVENLEELGGMSFFSPVISIHD